MEGKRFDELAKTLVATMPSRRGMLRGLVGGAIAGIAGGLTVGKAAGPVTPAGNDLVCEGRLPICNQSGEPAAVCGGDGSCVCARIPNGSKKCVDLTGFTCPKEDECDSNADCNAGEFCIVVARCCNGRKRNLCAPACTS